MLCMCAEPMAVRSYMSGPYTVVPQWLLGVQCYCMGRVFGLSQSECVGWSKWTLLPLQYTTLFVECQLVPNMVLCALGHVY